MVSQGSLESIFSKTWRYNKSFGSDIDGAVVQLVNALDFSVCLLNCCRWSNITKIESCEGRATESLTYLFIFSAVVQGRQIYFTRFKEHDQGDMLTRCDLVCKFGCSRCLHLDWTTAAHSTIGCAASRSWPRAGKCTLFCTATRTNEIATSILMISPPAGSTYFTLHRSQPLARTVR